MKGIRRSMRKGGKEDRRREKHSKRDFWDFGERASFGGRRGLYCCFGAGVSCWRIVLVFA